MTHSQRFGSGRGGGLAQPGPGAQHPRQAQPGGGPPDPNQSNVMREIPPNIPGMSRQSSGASTPPAYAANQKSTLERLKERYHNGELPPSLMKQATIERSLRAITRRMTSSAAFKAPAPVVREDELSLDDPLPPPRGFSHPQPGAPVRFQSAPPVSMDEPPVLPPPSPQE